MSVTTDSNTVCLLDLPSATESTRPAPDIEKYETALLMLAGFAGFSLIIGLGYNALRKYVFGDFHNLDTIFDAGGRVSLSLTAVTVTSQLLWPADFLQSPTLASKVGIGGTLWYTLAIVVSMFMFPVLCVQLKSRAPGAKTFPQVAYARFGKATHIMFCVIALFTNLFILANLILAGQAAVEVLTKDVSSEFVVMVLAVLFGSYCLVGGLGTTFYISYFNTALIFISTSVFILKITYLAEPDVEKDTSTESLYDAMSCLKGPEGNFQQSFLTFRTESGIIYGVVMFFMVTAVTFCDQANWQSRIAAKPKEGMIGYLIAGFLWFAIPTSLSFVSSMTYKNLSFKNGTNLLTDEEINKGYIAPFVIQTLLGKEGSFVFLTMLTMTLMSTGSGEVMSISSILIYDIVKIYVRPFRQNLQPTDCPLCGKTKLQHICEEKERDRCQCCSSDGCADCVDDVKTVLSGKLGYGFQYKCLVHRKYRHYEDALLQYKTWCMVGVVIAIVPYGLIINESGMDLNWAIFVTPVLIAPFEVPLFLTLAWVRATSKGLLSGGIIGLVAAIVGMLSYASTYEGGLSKFFINTAQDWSLMTGLLSGVVTSTVISVIVSMCTQPKQRNHQSNQTENGPYNSNLHGCLDIEWQKTMCIDNPLNPYRALYFEELADTDICERTVLTTQNMDNIFKGTKRVSYIAAAISFVVFLIIIPSVALSEGVLTVGQLNMWISVCHHCCMVCTVFVVLVPPIQEGVQIWRKYQSNRAIKKNENRNCLLELNEL